MSETQQHLVANLGNEHETAVGAHVSALARVGRHHAYPTRVHAALLPVHADLDTAVALRVGIAGDRRHLRLSHGHRHTGARKGLNRRGNGLEAVAVVAALTHLVDDLGDDEVAQALPGQLADTLKEGAVEADDGAHTELGHMALGSDVVGLCGVGCLLAAHVFNQLGLRVDAGKRVLARRPAVHAQRGAEGLARKLVVAVGKVGRGLVHLTVGRGMVGEHLLGTGKRLQAYLKGRERRAVLQFHRLRGVLGTAEDERGAVIVHPLLVLEGKTADEVEVRLVVLADVVELLPVGGVQSQLHIRLPAERPHHVADGLIEPREAARSRLHAVGGGVARDENEAKVAALSVKAHVSHHTQEDGLVGGMDRDGLSEPLGAAADIVYVAVAARLEVDAEVETVVAADALLEAQGLQRGKTGVTDADGDGGLGNGHWLVVF